MLGCLIVQNANCSSPFLYIIKNVYLLCRYLAVLENILFVHSCEYIPNLALNRFYSCLFTCRKLVGGVAFYTYTYLDGIRVWGELVK